jgi:hypothetical protein
MCRFCQKMATLDCTLNTMHLTCTSAGLSSRSFGSGVASSTSVSEGEVTKTLFVMGDGRRLGRWVVGTGSAVNDGGTVISLLGGFILVPPAPLGVEKRRVSGGVHTHASIVYSFINGDTPVGSYVVTQRWFPTSYAESSSQIWPGHSMTFAEISPSSIFKRP